MKSNSGFYISRIKQLNTRLLNKFLAKKNITAFNGEQGRILHVLWENDGISNRELSKKSGLAMSSLTTMLERMEEKNLLIRKFCPTDKRKSLIFLTDYAKSLKSEYDEISDKMTENTQPDNTWRQGAYTIYNETVGNKEVTIIGQLPISTAKRIVQDIQFNKN